jgi:hypothetical protein
LQADIDETFPGLAGKFLEPVIRNIKARRFVHERCADKQAIQFVSPGMIRAADATDVPCPVQEPGRTMDANIGKGLDRIVALPNHEYGRIDNVTTNEVAPFWNLRRSTDADPFLAKQLFYFEIENLCVVIDGRRQALRIVERHVRIPCQ